MKNIPRIYIDQEIEIGKQIPVHKDIAHYLSKVMRTDKCLVFNGGAEFYAKLENSTLITQDSTLRPDPSNNITLAFSIIKQSRMEEMLNMATQLGVARLIPVITDRVNEKYPKWERIKKIITEAAEQSGRNSIPILENPQKFEEFLMGVKDKGLGISLIFADERKTSTTNPQSLIPNPNQNNAVVLVGPEGGFSDAEFECLDKSSAVGISLGKTILRAEVAAVVALTIVNN